MSDVKEKVQVICRIADLSKVEQLPDEIKNIKGWCLSGASKAPLTIKGGEAVLANVNDPDDRLTLGYALRCAELAGNIETYHIDNSGQPYKQTGLNVGFVFSDDDPFCIIDLDDHGNLTPEMRERHQAIIASFDSYTEQSQSGNGQHILLKTDQVANVRRDNIEVYTSMRFVTLTGDKITDCDEIKNRDDILINMLAQMRSDGQGDAPYISRSANHSDDWVLEKCNNAATGSKFSALYAGDMSGYSSQSDADLALVTYLGFWTPDDDQVWRLFLQSGLGQRDKAKRPSYRKHTMTRMRQNSSSFDSDSYIDNKNDFTAMMSRLGIDADETPSTTLEPVSDDNDDHAGDNSDLADIVAEMQAEDESSPFDYSKIEYTSEECGAITDYPEMKYLQGETELDFPDNTLGELARYIYSISRVPLKEVSISAAIAAVAGMTGKAWSVIGKGLNLYVMLVAQSMTGKDILVKSIKMIYNQLNYYEEGALDFYCGAKMASSQALIKHLSTHHSVVHTWGEIGKDIEVMAKQSTAASAGLRHAFLNLFTASDIGSSLGKIAYSKSENDSVEYDGTVGYTVVGETTPTVFDNLDVSVFSDGFIGRFLIIEYRGLRKMPRLDDDICYTMPDALTQKLRAIIRQAQNHDRLCDADVFAQPTRVKLDKRAHNQMVRYQKMFNILLNSHFGEMKDQHLGRAVEKVLKIASIQAVLENPHQPIINIMYLHEAVKIVFFDLRRSIERLESGDVGSDDDARMRKMQYVIKEYKKHKPKSSYRANLQLWKNGIIERSYLMRRCYSFSCYKNARSGQSNAFEATLRDVVRNGALVELNHNETREKYNVNAVCYKFGDNF